LKRVVESSTRKEGNLLEATERLRQGLEGRSLRATLRLYLYGLAALAPIAVLLGYFINSQTLFLGTPLLVALLVIIQYWACYLSENQSIQTFKKAIHQPVVKYALELAAIIAMVCAYIGFKLGYEEASLKVITISVAAVGSIWLFKAVHNSISAIKEPTLRFALTIIIIVSVMITPAIFLKQISIIQFVNESSPQSPSQGPTKEMPYPADIAPRSHNRLRITEVSKVASMSYVVRGTGAKSYTPVWVVVHPIDQPGYWIQPPAQMESSEEWRALIYLGEPSTPKGKRFVIRAFANPTQPLKPGMQLHDWPEAQSTSEPKLVIR
jgi:hypothetical protein